eukprot:467404-Amphidinium_carterae.1
MPAAVAVGVVSASACAIWAIIWQITGSITNDGDVPCHVLGDCSHPSSHAQVSTCTPGGPCEHTAVETFAANGIVQIYTGNHSGDVACATKVEYEGEGGLANTVFVTTCRGIHADVSISWSEYLGELCYHLLFSAKVLAGYAQEFSTVAQYMIVACGDWCNLSALQDVYNHLGSVYVLAVGLLKCCRLVMRGISRLSGRAVIEEKMGHRQTPTAPNPGPSVSVGRVHRGPLEPFGAPRRPLQHRLSQMPILVQGGAGSDSEEGQCVDYDPPSVLSPH